MIGTFTLCQTKTKKQQCAFFFSRNITVAIINYIILCLKKTCYGVFLALSCNDCKQLIEKQNRKYFIVELCKVSIYHL